jgi:magnesium transporter
MLDTVEVGNSLRELIQRRNWDELRARIRDMNPSDVADLLIALPAEEEAFVFRVLPKDQAGEVFSYLPPDHQEDLIAALTNEQVRSVLQSMPPDDRTRLLEEVPAEVTRRLLTTLSPEDLKNTSWLLGYPDETAGRYMTPKYVTLDPKMRAGEALEHIRKTGRGKETIDVVYILDERGRLVEDIRLASLVLADPNTPVLEIDDPPMVSLHATDDR